jgi:hypothetical protein
MHTVRRFPLNNTKLGRSFMKAAQVPFAILLVIAGSAHAQLFPNLSSFESADLKAGKIHVKRIALLPIRVKVNKLDWKDSRATMEDASEQAQKNLWPIVAAALPKLGFSVDEATYSPDSLEKNQELSAKVGDLQEKFSEVNLLGEWRQKEFQKLLPDPFRETVSDLHPPVEVEAIAAAQISCTVETNGKKWANSGPGFHTAGGCYLQIGLIDPRTGVLIYIARSQGGDNWTQKPEKVAPHILKSFDKFTRYTPGS